MDTKVAVQALGALAQEHRLAAFRALVQAGPEGIPAGVLAERLRVAASSMSFHLAQLAQAGLVGQRRQGRSIIYAAEFGAMNALMGFLTENCCGGEACGGPAACVPAGEEGFMGDRVFNVLFLCTGNSARSILAEAMLNTLGEGRFHAFSAGSQPKGQVHPMALEVLREYGFAHDGFRSKNWREFEGEDTPHMDFVITVCDNAAGESCPVWPGQPMTAHWGIEDPAAVTGDGQKLAFIKALNQMRRRIELFVSLPAASLARMELEQRVRTIGREEGATVRALEGK